MSDKSDAAYRLAARVARVVRGPISAPTCRFCGTTVEIEFDVKPDKPARVVVSHEHPLCPEFARALEDDDDADGRLTPLHFD